MTELYHEVQKFIETSDAIPHLVFENAEVSQEILDIAETVSELTGTWNPVEIFTPSPESIDQEKTKFLEAFDNKRPYNPVFEYPAARTTVVARSREDLTGILHQVRSFTPQTLEERLFRVALYSKVRDDLATCDLVDGINNQDEALIESAINRKYGQIDDVITEYAQQSFEDMIIEADESDRASASSATALLTPEQQDYLKNIKLNASQIRDAFEWALHEYGILRTETNPGYKVVISDKVTAIDVRDKSEDPMSVYIPSDRTVSGDKIGELIAHEIEGHARQSMNGMEMFLIGGGSLKMDGEVLYEGLAKRFDESYRLRFFGENTGAPMPWYTLAIKKASEGASFYEIFDDQFEKRMRVKLKTPVGEKLQIDVERDAKKINNAKNLAWTATYRVMRGHVDTSNPLGFAMTKDLSYLKGWLMDNQLREAGYGGINEMAVIQTGGLQMMARLGAFEKEVPHPYQDVASEFILTKLLPALKTEDLSDSGQTNQ